MSEYWVKSQLKNAEWQVANQVGDHEFISDEKDAGPNPVEYLCGSVNSCITISAGMIVKAHDLDVKNFRLENHAVTEKLGHGQSVVTEMKIKLFFDTNMSRAEQEKFVAHVLHVSTVYQSIKEAIKIYVEFQIS